ncbi:MAG: phage portal protein [Patulibacter sp.]|nr:phage portal protein [Patulibacter sp.]
MAVFGGSGGAYVWADGSTQSMARPSMAIGEIAASVTLIGDRPISYDRIYRTQPWVAAAVHLLQRQVARLPIGTFIPTGDGESYNRRRTKDHGFASLLSTPADGRAPVDLKAEIMLDLAVQGNHLERIVRRTGSQEPIGLEKIDWRSVMPALSTDGMHVLAWRVTPIGGGATEVLMPEDVIHFRWPSPSGPIGVSPLQQLGVTIRSEDGAQRYADSAMRHGGMRGVAVRVDKEFAQDTVLHDTLREEILHKHSGPDRAHVPYIMGGVEAVEEMPTQSAVEVELIKLRQVNREEIAAVYGVPPVLIGDLSHATYSNVEKMHEMLYLTVLGPWLTLIEEQIAAQLVARYLPWQLEGVWCEWSLDAVMKGDVKGRMESYLIGLRAGALTINDIRRRENLPPFKNPLADEPLIQTNNVSPLSTIGNDTEGEPASKVPAAA